MVRKGWILMKLKLNKLFVLRWVNPKTMNWLRVKGGVDDMFNIQKFGEQFELVFAKKDW